MRDRVVMFGLTLGLRQLKRYANTVIPLSREFLLSRGFCCSNSCVNCPYKERDLVILMDYTVLEGARDPEQATEGSNGLDLFAYKIEKIGHSLYEYDTGVSVAIPQGHVGLLFPRSSISNTDMYLRNCVGVVDSDYRGTIKARFTIQTQNKHLRAYRQGDKICQLVIVPQPAVKLCRVDTLPQTKRGSGGFGSTGG